jgi:TRAP-type mannitol/chloroaromatic compound transport system permease small subunit
MNGLLALARGIDWVSERVGRLVYWLVLAIVLIASANAISRYVFSMSSNAWLELQWYLFSVIFLCGSGYALKHGAHVRIDLVANRFSRRTLAKVDIFGFLLMMLPVCFFMIWFGWNAFSKSIGIWEQSPDPGGLARWPIKFILPLGFALLALQGVAELIKRVAFLRGDITWEGMGGNPDAGTPPPAEAAR